ncbi:MAG: homoserine O-acetyltransferase [Lysobacterales bacterium]|jgi:homoserine O-acetyltransferase
MKCTLWSMFLLLLLPQTVLAESTQLFASIGDLKLQSGEVIIDARVGYRTAGKLNADKSNVIVIPSWHTGSSLDLFSPDATGPGKLADTDRYYVIGIDALANGVSSSPSNSPKQAGGLFPDVSISDMVHSQHMLLADHLGIDHVFVIMGMSMGGMQTLQWIGEYPGFMDKAVSIEGSPKMTSYDLIQWQTHVDAIDLMQGAGIANQEITSFLQQLTLLTLWTRDYLVENISVESLDTYLASYQQQYDLINAFDYRVQTKAMIEHDVLALKPFTEDFKDELRPEILIIGFDSDHMVNPETSKALASSIGASYVEVISKCGHMGTVCEAEKIATLVNSFLD